MFFAFVCETENDFYAISLLVDSRERGEKLSKQSVSGTVKVHFVGNCEDVSDHVSLYEKACKKAASLRDKNKPVAGCNEKTGGLF